MGTEIASRPYMQNQMALSPLSYPARLFVVAKYLGFIFLISTGLVLVPLIASLFWQEYEVMLRYGVIGALFLILGLLTLAIPRPKTIQSNEAYSVVALSFLLGSFAMAYPLMGSGLNFIDAWFESVSGLTTTGLSVADTSPIQIKTFYFARSWMQWYGGLGIIVFSLSLAYHPGSIAKTFIKQLAYKDDRIENSKIFARKILIIYFVMTLIGIITLHLFGLGLIEAVEFTFSALSTGGFSPYADSLESLSQTLQSLIIFIGFLGALSFPLFWLVNLESVKTFFQDIQFRGLIICSLVFTVLMFLLNGMWFSYDVLLNAISIQTTAGFSLYDLSELNAATRFMLLFSMLIGGGTLSTAGGIKIIRFVIIIQALRFLFFRTSLTKSSVVSENHFPEVIQCLCLFALYIIVIFASTLVFIAMGYPPLDSLFDVVSAIGTVGVSSGVTAASMPTILKIVLGIDMLLGRLEVVTLLVILYPRTLIGRRNKT